MFAIWLCAWGMWSCKLPYFMDDVHYHYQFTHEPSLFETFHKGFIGNNFVAIRGFERLLYVPYGWLSYRLGAPLHHVMIAFFHFIAAYLFWIFLNKLKIPYIFSLCTALIFLCLPISYEAIYFVANMQPISLCLFIITCLLFLNFRHEKRVGIKIMYAAMLNCLLFILCLGHPSFVPGIILLITLESTLSLKECAKWTVVIKRTIITALVLSAGPIMYVIGYKAIPLFLNTQAFNRPAFDLYWFFRTFLSTQYHGCRALASMLSPEWIMSSFASVTSSFLIFLVFAISSVILYFSCFHDMKYAKSTKYPTRLVVIDIVWGYAWMVSAFSIYMMCLGFASNSRSYYVASLGISIMMGSIVHIFHRKFFSQQNISLFVFIYVMILVFFACGVGYRYEGTLLFWKASLNRAPINNTK